jgi:drug/metabolite transporter (DMT)-like permease
MKRRKRLNFVIPVLLIAGVSYSIWAYYTRGISGLRTRSEVWLLASAAAILMSLFVRILGGNTNDEAKDRRRWVDPSWIVWMVFAGGAAVMAFLFGLGKSTAATLVTMVTVLLILVYSRFSLARGKTDKPTTE